MRHRKKRSWFFKSKNRKLARKKERNFCFGLITGASVVTLLTLFLILLLKPPVAGRMLGIKRFGGEMCQEKACYAMLKPEIKEKGCTPGLRTACVNILLKIEASRRLVIDPEGKIIKIYSNTIPTNTDFRIFASYQEGGKEEITVTDEIWKQYYKLKPEINWGERGLVYEYRPSLAKKTWSSIQNILKTTLSSVKELQAKQISANFR